MTIEPATQEDAVWVKALFEANSAILGVDTAGPQWYRFWAAKNPREYWFVIRPLAFVHFLIRKDGFRTVYEIAVQADQRKQGLARSLMDRVGRPVRLKTDADNEASNRFYRTIGLLRTGQTKSRDGTKTFNVYEG